MNIYNYYSPRFKNKPILTCYNDFKITDEALFDPKNVVVLDTETTGLDACGIDEIIQVGGIKKTNEEFVTLNFFVTPTWFSEDELIENFTTLQAQNKLGDLNLEHQIALIKQGFNSHHNLYDLANTLEQWVRNKVVVMYNGTSFDANLINKVFGMVGKKVAWACLDAMILTYRLGFEPIVDNYRISYKQRDVGAYFQIINEDSHNAVGDCKQLWSIYERLIHVNENVLALIHKYTLYSILVNRICLLTYNYENKLVKTELYNHQITSYLLCEELKNKQEIHEIVANLINNSTELEDVRQLYENSKKQKTNNKIIY